METKKVNALSDSELQQIFGGGPLVNGDTCDAKCTNCARCATGKDSTDCTSECASGGTTTDTE
jgi:hypothetical protein